jgi:hypothetical protein
MSEGSQAEAQQQQTAPLNVVINGQLLSAAVEDMSAFINHATKLVSRPPEHQHGVVNALFDNMTSLLPILAALVDGFPFPDDLKESVILTKRQKVEAIIAATTAPQPQQPPQP